MKIADIIIAILFITLILISTSFLTAKGDEVLISADGKEYMYPLSEDRIIPVSGPLGETTVEIKDGNVSIAGQTSRGDLIKRTRRSHMLPSKQGSCNSARGEKRG